MQIQGSKQKLKLFWSVFQIIFLISFMFPPEVLAQSLSSIVRTGAINAAWPAFREILQNLGIQTSAVREQGGMINVIERKDPGAVPKVTITFTPERPRVGEKVTAVAAASGFSNDLKQLYYTWFLKHKECDLKPSTFNYRSRSNYGGSGYLDEDVDSGDNRSQKDCDSDEDNLISVNDWKIFAGREIVQNGFKPDESGKYSDSDFYDIREDWNESEDEDGYQAWQGGGDTERMPAHCYAYHPTTGKTYELLRNNLGAGAVPTCANGQLAVCGVTRNFTLYNADYNRCTCDENPAHSFNGNVGAVGTGECANLPYPIDPGSPPEGFTCADADTCTTSGGTTCYYGHGLSFWHYECQESTFSTNPQRGHFGCEVSAVEPRCVEIRNGRMGTGTNRQYIGELAAVCGEDVDEDGLDDTPDSPVTRAGYTNRMIALCPTGVHVPEELGEHNPNFESQVDTGADAAPSIQGSESYYQYYSGPGSSNNLPVCNCDREQIFYSNPPGRDDVPYMAVCDGDAIRPEDFLCGSGGTGSTRQFHVFPWSVSIDSERTNYYLASRQYILDGNRWSYSYRQTGYDTGDGDFDADEEKFWLTDPRNPSTAGNGQYDESNLAGKGIGEFTWIYEEGDEVGVAVEGTSPLPTKYSDSSRMIFWAFSAGPEYENKCLVSSRGPYNPQRSLTAGRRISIEAGFLDFDQCAAYSTISPVAGGSLTGGQPSGLEVDISLSPKSPRNDESGEGRGDILIAQAVTSGSSLGENNLEYEWTIKKIVPYPTGNSTGNTRKPTDKDWADVARPCSGSNPDNCVLCGSGSGTGNYACPFRTSDGHSLKTKGLGLSQLSFPLNLCNGESCENDIDLEQYFNPNGDGYLQFTVRARESGSETNSTTALSGQTSEEVKIVTSGNTQLTVFRPTVSGSSGNYTLNSPGTPICRTGPVCQVAPNDIIGLQSPVSIAGTGANTQTLDNFQWTKDDTILDCDSSISGDCEDDRANEFMFLPVTDSPGTTFTVKVKASNVSGSSTSATGRSLELSRKFQVMAPEARIYPADVDCAATDLASEGNVRFKKVGTQVNPAKNEESPSKYKDDYSRSVLVAQSSQTVTIKACYFPEYLNLNDLAPLLSVNWISDGVAIPAPSFNTGDPGAVHNLQVSGSYRQTQDWFQVLFQKFGVPKSSMVGQPISAAVQIEALDPSQFAAQQKESRFFAGLISRIPSRALFLLRILFALLAVIVFSGALFSLFPLTSRDYRQGAK